MINDVCTEQLFGYLLIQHWWNKIFSSLVLAQCSITYYTYIFLLRIKKIDECAVLIFFFLAMFCRFCFSSLTKVELVNITHFQVCLQVEYHWCAIAFNLRLSNQFHTPLINYFEIRFNILHRIHDIVHYWFTFFSMASTTIFLFVG